MPDSTLYTPLGAVFCARAQEGRADTVRLGGTARLAVSWVVLGVRYRGRSCLPPLVLALIPIVPLPCFYHSFVRHLVNTLVPIGVGHYLACNTVFV